MNNGDSSAETRVVVGPAGTNYHDPADSAKPMPACQASICTDATWSWMDEAQAEVWRDRCAYCSEDYTPNDEHP